MHRGHLAIAAHARDHFNLTDILFIPSGNPPHKARTGASASERLAMLKAALRSNFHFRIWDRELRRKGTSFTIDTLRVLAREFPGRPLYFILGSDNLREIETWRRYREVVGMVTLCVAHRPGYPLRRPRALAGARILRFPSPECGVSSTMVRERLARGYSCRRLVPPAVAEYIFKRKLYRP